MQQLLHLFTKLSQLFIFTNHLLKVSFGAVITIYFAYVEKLAILIKTVDKYNFLLIDKEHTTTGVLQYDENRYTNATISIHKEQLFQLKKKTAFNAVFSIVKEDVEVGSMEISTRNSIMLQIGDKLNKYTFRKIGFWKTRFVLFSKEDVELVALLPIVSWNKNSYNFKLQINEELNEKIDNLLIILALHCTIYSLVMMYSSVY